MGNAEGSSQGVITQPSNEKGNGDKLLESNEKFPKRYGARIKEYSYNAKHDMKDRLQ